MGVSYMSGHLYTSCRCNMKNSSSYDNNINEPLHASATNNRWRRHCVVHPSQSTAEPPDWGSSRGQKGPITGWKGHSPLVVKGLICLCNGVKKGHSRNCWLERPTEMMNLLQSDDWKGRQTENWGWQTKKGSSENSWKIPAIWGSSLRLVPALIRPLSVNTYLTCHNISVLSEGISMKFSIHIHHVSGHCWKGFQGQRSKVKITARPCALFWHRHIFQLHKFQWHGIRDLLAASISMKT